jgi:hypothetical protein
MPEVNDADAAALETLRRIVANAKGDELERAEAILRRYPDWSIPGDYLRWETEKTIPVERERRAAWQAAHDLLERLVAERGEAEASREYRIRVQLRSGTVITWTADSLEHAKERAAAERRLPGCPIATEQVRIAAGEWRDVGAAPVASEDWAADGERVG